jgi:hypothetical protein
VRATESMNAKLYCNPLHSALFSQDLAGYLLLKHGLGQQLLQARALARTLCGERTPYNALPWFWSDQGSMKLQMAGDSFGASKVVAVDGEKVPQAAAFCFNKQDHLCAVEAINWPAYHALSRKALSDDRVITRAHLESACPLPHIKK